MVRNKARESNNMISAEKSAGRGFKFRPRLQSSSIPLRIKELKAQAAEALSLPNLVHWKRLRPTFPRSATDVFGTPGTTESEIKSAA